MLAGNALAHCAASWVREDVAQLTILTNGLPCDMTHPMSRSANFT
jgi:hypothetical protein